MNSPRISLAVVLGGACALGVFGIRWGLPSRERALRVFPEGPSCAALRRDLLDVFDRTYTFFGHDPQSWPTSWRPPSSDFPQILLFPALTYLLFSQHPDEHTLLFSTGELRPRGMLPDAVWHLYGGGYLYPLKLFLRVSRIFSQPVSVRRVLAEQDYGTLRRLYVGGRLLSVVSYLLCIIIVYKIGCVVRGQEAGLWSAALFGTCPGVVSLSHVMKPHLWSACLCLLALACALETPPTPWRRRISLMVLGTALGSTLSSWTFFPLCVWVLAGQEKDGSLAGWIRLVELAVIPLVLLLGLNWTSAASFGDFLYQMRRWFALHPLVVSRAAAAEYFSQALRSGMGTFLLYGGGAVVLGSLGRRGRLPFIFSSYILIAFLYSSFQYKGYGQEGFQFFIAPVGMLCVLVAAGLGDLSFRLWGRWNVSRMFLWILLLPNLVSSAVISANFVLAEGSRSHERTASDWIGAHIPEGRPIGIAQPVPTVDAFPAVPLRGHPFVYLEGGWIQPRKNLPEFFVYDPISPWRLPGNVRDYYQVALRAGPRILGVPVAFIDRFSYANFPVFVLRRRYLPQ